jgi:hypothetical protein
MGYNAFCGDLILQFAVLLALHVNLSDWAATLLRTLCALCKQTTGLCGGFVCQSVLVIFLMPNCGFFNF